MANSPKQYYSYEKLEKFRRCERSFRSIQAILLLFMILCFIFYLITLGIDIAKYLKDPPLLAASISIVIIALIFLVIGIRGVAFESFCKVLTFAIVFFLVTIAHGLTLLYRHIGLTITNLILALLLFIGSIIYLCYLCRMNRLKPPDYGKTNTNKNNDNNNDDDDDDDDDAESRIALNSKKKIIDLKLKNDGEFTDLKNREIIIEPSTLKKESINLQTTGTPNNEINEKEFVSVKRILLNETPTNNDEKDLINNNNNLKQQNEHIVKHNINLKGGYDLERELRGSFKSNLGDIEKEFNIFQREFPDVSSIANTNDQNVQRMLTTVRKGFEQFKSGGENVKREIVEVKRDEAGNITSYIERRFTDSGVEICSVSVDKNRAPIANFTNN